MDGISLALDSFYSLLDFERLLSGLFGIKPLDFARHEEELEVYARLKASISSCTSKRRAMALFRAADLAFNML